MGYTGHPHTQMLQPFCPHTAGPSISPSPYSETGGPAQGMQHCQGPSIFTFSPRIQPGREGTRYCRPAKAKRPEHLAPGEPKGLATSQQQHSRPCQTDLISNVPHPGQWDMAWVSQEPFTAISAPIFPGGHGLTQQD